MRKVTVGIHSPAIEKSQQHCCAQRSSHRSGTIRSAADPVAVVTVIVAVIAVALITDLKQDAG